MKKLIVIALALQGACLYKPWWSKDEGDPALDKACEKGGDSTPDGALCWAMFDRRDLPAVKKPELLAEAIDFFIEHHEHPEDSLPEAYVRAQELDEASLAAVMQEAGVDPRIAGAFQAKIQTARGEVIKEVDALPPRWKQVYVEPALRARAQWAKDHEARGPWIAKAQALIDRADQLAIDHHGDAALLDQMIALHRAYVAECVGAPGSGIPVEWCLGDEVARPLTSHIVQLAWDSGDHERARAEDVLLVVTDRSQRAYLEYLDSKQARDLAKQERDAYDKAKSEGRSESALASKWPIEPIAVDDLDLPGAPPPDAPEFDTGDHGWPHASRAVIAAVAKKGPRTLITFVRDVETSESAAECHETNRVDSIGEDGHLNYREECSGSVTDRTDLTEKPITVPAEEAARLRPGEILTFIADDHHRGHVIEAYAADKSVRGGTLMSDDKVSSPKVQLGPFRLVFMSLTGAGTGAGKANRTPSR
ncbi:MAG TPA: hypothetical protein VL463_01275 [Kofleriaceae bacterium]|nr:hypothetical protein [Kofleriaceae bacterium]